MNGGDDGAVRGSDEDGGAVGDADAGELARVIGNDGVGLGVRAREEEARLRRGVMGAGHGADFTAVDLVDLDDGARGRLHRREQTPEVLADVGGRVLAVGGEIGGVAEVQGVEGRGGDATVSGW